MKLVLASRNNSKIKELSTLLSDGTQNTEILSLNDIGYNDEIIENGKSFEENALIKASVPAKLGYIGIADDSGLCVDALNGAPGIYSARYAGEPSNDIKNNEKLLAELKELSLNDRTAKFVCTIAAVAPNGNSFVVRGECKGIILRQPLGKSGFGYDPLFYYEDLHKTFAELSPDEKNQISHRALAMKEFKKRIFDFCKLNGV